MNKKEAIRAIGDEILLAIKNTHGFDLKDLFKDDERPLMAIVDRYLSKLTDEEVETLALVVNNMVRTASGGDGDDY